MPEGPSILILKEAAQQFEGKKVTAAAGNTQHFNPAILLNKKVLSFKTWGKHFLICFDGGLTVKIHLLLFGSYRINEEKDAQIRLNLTFSNGWINFYAASVKLLEDDPDAIYDWTTDVMNDDWDAKAAAKKIKAQPDELICDTLLDQDIFSGVGNIIKNEILYRCKVHPESRNGKIPPAKLKCLIREARNYSFDFLDWKKHDVLKKHWLVHTKKKCPEECAGTVTKKITGKRKRRSFFCEKCQQLYT